MPYPVDLLNDKQILNAKNTTGKRQYLNDGAGLRILLDANGSKYWIFRFRLQNKAYDMSFGTYPEVGLKAARDKRLEAKKLVKKGIHPRDHWDSHKETNLKALDSTFKFKNAYQSTMDELEQQLKDTSITRYKGIYRLYFEKQIGHMSLFNIDAKVLRTALLNIRKIKTVQQRGHNKTATIEQAIYLLNNIYKYAKNIGFDLGNPTPVIKSLNLPPPKDKHHEFVHPDYAGEYWNKIKSLTDIQDRVFLKLNVISVLRANTQSNLTWRMFESGKNRLVIPKELLKNDRGFITYLPAEIVDDLIELRKVKVKTNKELAKAHYKPIYNTDDDGYIFSSQTPTNQFAPYNKNRPAKLIKKWGGHFKDKTLHGNRSLFTILAKQKAQFKFPREAVQFQLSHARGNKKGVAIEHYIGHISDWDKSRIELVNWWCDYINEQEKAYILSNTTIKKAQTSKAKKSN